jgi:uncharacterized membrane protein affecting hemolysin expression
MGRLQLWGAVAAALLVAVMGGAVWWSEALGRARAEGVAAGRAQAALALEAASARRRAAAEAALARTNAQIADLERSREQLQESYNAVVAQSIREPSGSLLCLGPGVVRGLDALGRDGGALGAGP